MARLCVLLSVFRHLALVLIATSIIPTLQAQISNVTNVEATPIPGAGHDYLHLLNETINPANGSVSVRIGVPVPIGRGLTLPFSFTYDSNSAHSQPGQAGGYPLYLSQGGWSYSMPVLRYSHIAENNKATGQVCHMETGFVFSDAEGTRHALNNMLITLGGDCAAMGYSTNPTGSDAWILAQEGSGIRVQDADATTYSFSPSFSLSGGSNIPTSVEDRNGNMITYVDSGNGVFKATDTAGRTVISSNGFGASGNTVTVSGLSNAYSLTWGETASWNYDAGIDVVVNGSGNTCNTPPSTLSGSVTVLSAIKLPNGQSFQFHYDPTYGLLNEIDYPTGGKVVYTWGLNAQSEMASASAVTQTGGSALCYYRFSTPVITQRSVYFTNSSTPDEVQSFNFNPPDGTTWSSSEPQVWTTKGTSVTTTDNVRGQNFNTSYTYSPFTIPQPPELATTIGTQVPVEQQIVYSNWDGSVLQTVKKTWQNQYLMTSEQTVLPNGATSQVKYTYGNLGVVTNKSEYDYGLTLTRQTITNYQSFPANALGSFIYDRPCQVLVEDGSGAKFSETDYLYDGSTGAVCGTAGTPSGGGISNLTNHDETNFGPTKTGPRGNATQKSQWLNTGTSPATKYAFDEAGQVTSKIDPCGSGTCSDMNGTTHTTTYDHSDSYSSGTPPGTTDVYLTKITNALGQSSTFSYGYADGQLTSATDPNSKTTTYKYGQKPSGCSFQDQFDRLGETDFPDGGITTICYNDSPYNASTPSPSVTTSEMISSSVSKVTTVAYDGIGHPIQSKLSSDPDGITYTSTTFDGLGLLYTVSNPYRTTGDSTYGITTHFYDALGRTTQVTEPDGSNISTSYSQNSSQFLTTVTDEVGNQRMSHTDGLGRLTEVDEPSNVPNTAATATITITGSGIQSVQTSPATPGTGSVTVTAPSGGDRTTCCCLKPTGCGPPSPTSCSNGYTLVSDSGVVSITVNGHKDSVTYGGADTSASVAQNLTTAIKGDSSAPESAGQSGSTVDLTSVMNGASTNYQFSTSSSTTYPKCFSSTSFPISPASGSLTGGADAVYKYDQGTVSATVNGCTASVPYSLSTNSTASQVASALAGVINSTCSASVSNASASGNVITLTTTATGPVGDGYTLSAGSASSNGFSPPSFGANPDIGGFSGGSDPGLQTPYITQYSHDPLNNLLKVTQNGSNSSNARVRTFVYDSLSRLTSAANPESGTITYTFDLNGNLSSKVAPKPNQTSTSTVTTNFSYDVLNRATKKSYVNLSTPAALFGYDGTALTGCSTALPTITGATNLVGRMSAMCSGNSSSAFSYDPMGRPSQKTANHGSVAKTYSVNYLYYKDGSVNTITYPSGGVVTYTVGGAGRVTQVSDGTNNFAISTSYAPQGAVASMANGTAIVTSNTYNKRLQPALLSATANGSTIFSLCYDFHLGVAVNGGPSCSINTYATGDNGNVFRILNTVDGTRSTAFQYDPLNRIAQANTINTTSSNCWGEVYTLDAWGNLTNRSGPAGMGTCVTEGLSLSANTQNRLSGLMYDAAGNVTNDGNGNTPTFDAENRIVTDAGMTYSYDADGIRIEKSAGTSGTMYWHGTDGEYLAETDLSGNINEEYIFLNEQRIARVDRPSGTVHYYLSNHLGSHNIVMSASGACEQDIDYFPYGGIVIDHCPTVAQHYKFTAKERDSESGLDNFEARHYGSSLGRFMSPDPVGGHNEDPQTLNRYAYVRNNPLSLTDPTGLDFYLSCQTASDTCQKDKAGNLVQGTTTTSTDANGNTTSTFTPTVVTSASLQDPNSGNTGTVNENGVQITTANGQTSEGIFINGTPSADLAGSGKLEGFLFNINGSDEKSGNLDYGNYVYTGSRNQPDVVKLLGERGAFTYGLERTFGNYHHEGELNFRFSSGAHPNLFNYGPSLHLLVSQDPKATVPVGPGYKGNFHVDSKTGPQHLACAEKGIGCTN